MKSRFLPGIGGVTRLALVALAVLAISMPATQAFGDIAYKVSAPGGSIGPTTVSGDNFSFSKMPIGDFQVSLTVDTDNGVTDPSVGLLHTTTIDVDNKGKTTETVDIVVSGLGFSIGKPGDPIAFSCSVQGTSGDGLKGQIATAQSWLDTTNGSLTMPLGGTGGLLTGSLHATAPPNSVYDFTNGGSCPPITLIRGATDFSMTQEIKITLAPGKQGSITMDSTAFVPEPSSMALAGIGAMSMISFGLLRRRRGA
jgi:hypothetical protein